VATRRPGGLDRLQRDRLPFTTPPFQDETVASYTFRLARLNELDLRLWVSSLADDSGRTQANRLSVASGYPIRTLKFAMPELCETADLDSMKLAGRVRPMANPPGLACRMCTAARGIEHNVWRWGTHDDVVCLRHSRWTEIGRTAFAADQPQPGLSRQPEILDANRLHRALIRRRGRDEALRAFRLATSICRRWWSRDRHQETYERLMASFHGPYWSVRHDHATVAASRYPQQVALTRLLLSPRWRALAHEPPHRHRHPSAEAWNSLADEICRTVAPNYDDRARSNYLWPIDEPIRKALVELEERAANAELVALEANWETYPRATTTAFHDRRDMIYGSWRRGDLACLDTGGRRARLASKTL
jgi:TniQ protein